MPGIKSPGDNKLKIAPEFKKMTNSLKGVDKIGIESMKLSNLTENLIGSTKSLNKTFSSPGLFLAQEQLGKQIA